MTYTPYLIANFASGINKRLQPWLIMDDAQEQLFDGYVYRGTMSKREGYVYFATGGQGGSTYRDSRIVHTLTAVSAAEVPNGIIVTFTLAGTAQIARGSVTVNGSSPVVVGVDNGLGVIGSITGAGIVSGTVNYRTGAISVTFSVAPAIASTVTFTYSFMPGNPVMMIANFITATNVKELIVADTRYVNRYNATLNILQEIVPATTPYTGDKFQFFTWTNYASATFTPRLLFSNNKDPIQQYDGTNIIDYVPTLAAPATLTCAYMVEFKDRLILLRPNVGGTIFPQRIMISGTGANCDDFRTSATGAGFIDIPDGTWINGAAFNRDDLIIFTAQATWVLKYTGNDTTPFVLDKIDESRGSDATFSSITYLNRTSAVSKRGLIISDGYRVERQDLEIPDFSFNEVSQENFALCFAGVVDADRDHYLIYPPDGQDTSKRILTTNYDEDNYSIYRFPLSCMGTYLTAFTVTWNGLTIYPNWASFGAAYGNWNSFSYSKGDPFSVGGGQNGEIWRLAVSEQEDNLVRIYAITVIDAVTIQVTTDFNNFSLNGDDPTKGADFIFLTGMTGMDEINSQQFPIIEIVNANTFKLRVTGSVVPATSFTAYTSGGYASRVIPFSALFKQFNPYIDQDKKVRCGWLYVYVDSSDSDLRKYIPIDEALQQNPCVISTAIDHGLSTGAQVTFMKVGGMTQLNTISAFITVIDPQTFSLNDVNATAFGAYTSGGYVSVPVPAKIDIEILTNSRYNQDYTQKNGVAYPYEGNCTNLTFQDGVKKWYKVFINQTGNFIQFRMKNQQAGATINIQAFMPGFQPVGRIL